MILNSITWNVNPEIFPLGPFSIRYYGLLFAAGFYIGYMIVRKMFRIEGLSDELLDKLTIYMVVATVIGARLGHCLFYEPEYYLKNPIEILMVWHGGLASHGGAIGILVALLIFSRKFKKPYIWVLDRIVVPTALAGCFIRLGNLMNSEIYGYETDLPWGFIFVRSGETVAKHPTQIYEALSYLVIFVILYFIYFKAPKKGNPRPGLLFSLFLILVFTARFIIEYVKEVQVDMETAWALKLGQSLSIPFIVAGLAILIWSYRNKNYSKV
jgi:prolipoprotein diacylglyceryl transferase